MRNKINNMSKRSLAFFAAALLLLGAGGISASMAAFNAVSDTYDAELNMAAEMKVAIVEGSGNDAKVVGENDAILTALKDNDGNSIRIAPGEVYDETLSLRNETGHPMYVRAVVRKYWLDAEGNKGTNLEGEKALDPALITLSYKDEEYNTGDWILNEDESTAETTVYYYKNTLTDDTTPLFDGVSVSPDVIKEVKTETKSGGEDGMSIVTYSYKYDGCTICLEVEAQAVQTHNAEDAIKSIWGVGASVAGGSIQSIG